MKRTPSIAGGMKFGHNVHMSGVPSEDDLLEASSRPGAYRARGGRALLLRLLLSPYFLIAAAWLAVALLLTGQTYWMVYSAILAQPDLEGINPKLAPGELFLNAVGECAIWTFLTFAIIWLAKRFPFERARWPRACGVHLAASTVCSGVQSTLAVLCAEVVRSEYPKPTISLNVLVLFFVVKLNSNIFIYWAILAVVHAVTYYRRLREREIRSTQLEAKLAQTQLQVLKMQLHPHFLFNTLNAISALIHKDVDLADRMIARLGDLLRATLENANRQEVSLRQELDFIDPYLEIEKARFGPRLTIQLHIDPAALDARVPNLILQPLVENAVRHGIAPRATPGKIAIHACRENGFLRLQVEDDGPGLPPGAAPCQGIGLSTTRARLEKLYGAEQHLSLRNRREGGLVVDVTIPFHELTEAV
jgi:two-component system, LytTR family, sensor kinase